MADFLVAYKLAMTSEGGYSNDKNDNGGETYAGISRRYYPMWQGWSLVDICKLSSEFPANLKYEKDLPKLVEKFYRQNYWNLFLGDEISEDKQLIANELFDSAINQGLSTSVRFLQIGLNCLNKNSTLWADMTADGVLGNKTLNTLNNLNAEDTKLLYLIMNLLQGNKYIEIMQKNPSQENFARGWFRRVTIEKA